jgi:uncharacterized protein (DUF1800 family)
MIVKPKASEQAPPQKPEEIIKTVEAEIPKAESLMSNDIGPEFLVKSEQDKIKKREKRKKFKNNWKDHMQVLKLMDDEEKAKMDVYKKRTLELAEQMEYEDEFDDLVLERQVSKPTADVTQGTNFQL